MLHDVRLDAYAPVLNGSFHLCRFGGLGLRFFLFCRDLSLLLLPRYLSCLGQPLLEIVAHVSLDTER